MKPRVLYRRNPDEVVETAELVAIAKDMVKEGKLDAAKDVLVDEGKMGDAQVGAVFFQAVAEELATGKRRGETRKLFNKVRKRYRDLELPRSLWSLVTFNEANVERDMMIALGCDADDLAVLKSRHQDGMYEVSFGRQEYYVVKNEEAAEQLAISYVEDDLKDEPESFHQDFIARFRDAEKLQQLVIDIAMEDDYVFELDDGDFWKVAMQHARGYGGHLGDLVIPEEDEDGEMPAPTREYREALRQVMASEAGERAEDYLEDALGAEEAHRYIAQHVPIDIEAAAKAAVAEDGAGHFLATYDGNTWETISGFTYWRVN